MLECDGLMERTPTARGGTCEVVKERYAIVCVCSVLKSGNMSNRHMCIMLRCGQCPSNLDLAAITFFATQKVRQLV